MMLFKLSLKNIQKSFKDYAIYFFTLILGISIFYVFNAIDSQTVLLDVTKTTYEIIDLMVYMLSSVSVFVSFILGFLIIYASRFLIKRRSKEFGIYLTLGMSKRKISMILFFETLIIGILSLVIGLFLGVILSQFMSLLVASMFEADMTKFTFVFSESACIKTLIYFAIMYLLVMIFNTVNISKFKLIDLLHGSKKSEKIKLKSPIICTIIFIISSTILGYAYYLVTFGIDKLQGMTDIYIPIILGCITTFFIFWSLSGLLLKIFMSIKKFYYKGLNSFTLRQFSSKINTTVFSMTIICLMLFVTICVLSSALSIKNSMTGNLNELAPADVQLYKELNLSEEEYTPEQIADSKLSIKETLSKLDFDVDKYYKDIIEFSIYSESNITVKATLGSAYEEASSLYPRLLYDNKEMIVRLSDYNKIAKLFGLEQFTLEDDEYILIADFDGWIPVRNMGLKANTPITLLGKNYYPKYDECKNGFIEISSNHINFGIFIVPDDAVNDSLKSTNYLIANYNASDKEGKRKIEEMLINTGKSDYASSTTIEATTRISIAEASNGLGALVTFIGLYLGIVFLISSAAILALKELSESSDNKERFYMLRKIGTDEKMLNKTLFRQIGIFFLFPLLIAIIHSIFGIMFFNYILLTLGNDQLLPSIIMTAIFIVIIYGGYFLITYQCSKNIIKDR